MSFDAFDINLNCLAHVVDAFVEGITLRMAAFQGGAIYMEAAIRLAIED